MSEDALYLWATVAFWAIVNVALRYDPSWWW